MTVRIITKQSLAGSARNVRNSSYETTRFLLASDRMGVTVTDIVIQPGPEAVYGYDKHVEIAYCIEGEAVLTDLATEQSWKIAPGTMWVAEKGDHFNFRAETPVRLICVFTPAFDGHETGFAGDQ